jgi:hypothetical protein
MKQIERGEAARHVFTSEAARQRGARTCGIAAPYNTVHKTQWREASGYVDRHARVNDLVLIDGGRGAVAALLDHYLKRTGIDTRAKNTGSFKEDAGQITETYAGIWDVTQAPPDVAPRWVEENIFSTGKYNSTAHERYHRLDLTLYEKKKP